MNPTGHGPKWLGWDVIKGKVHDTPALPFRSTKGTRGLTWEPEGLLVHRFAYAVWENNIKICKEAHSCNFYDIQRAHRQAQKGLSIS